MKNLYIVNKNSINSHCNEITKLSIILPILGHNAYNANL